MRLSIIIPAFNEEKRLPRTLMAIKEYLSKQNYSYEIIIVDDGSRDRTSEYVKKMMRQNNNLRLIRNEKNYGKGKAVKDGMLNARGKYCIYLDADNAISIEQIEKFWPYFKNGYDLVIGSIEVEGAKTGEPIIYYRHLFGKWAKLLIRLLTIREIHDSQRAFKLFPGPVAKKIFSRQTINGWGFDIEILVIAKKLGYKIKELPVTWINSPDSKITPISYLKTLQELFIIKWNLLKGKYNY